MPALSSSSASPFSHPMPLVTDLLATPPSTVTVNPACSQSLHPIDNEHFSGRLMLKLRPPNCPPPPSHSTAQPQNKAVQCSSATAASTPVGGCCECCYDFFARHPSVQLELAVQGRFLRPVSRVWMGAELGGSSEAFSLTLPFLKRSVIKLMAGIISTFISNVKWTMGDKRVDEFPLIAFPLVSAMDCVLSSPLSEAAAAPAVGWQRLSMDASHRSSMSFEGSEFDPSRLYTLAFYSDQLDLARWKAVNVPGGPVDLRSVWLNHPLTLLAYTLIDQHGPHSQHNRRTLFAVQLQPPNTQQSATQQQQHAEEKDSAHNG